LGELNSLPEQAHEHADQEEAFYVISGELIVEVGELIVTAPTRSFVLVPRGIRHRHVAAAGARLRAIYLPGHAFQHGLSRNPVPLAA